MSAQASAAADWRVGGELPRKVAQRAHAMLRELFQVASASQADVQAAGAAIDVAERLAGGHKCRVHAVEGQECFKALRTWPQMPSRAP